jgi:hypothetical protein
VKGVKVAVNRHQAYRDEKVSVVDKNSVGIVWCGGEKRRGDGGWGGEGNLRSGKIEYCVEGKTVDNTVEGEGATLPSLREVY